MRRRLILLLAAALGTLLGLELVCRALGLGVKAEAFRTDVVLPGPGGVTTPVGFGFIPGATIRTTYPSDPRGYFGEDRSIDHVFASTGWRGREVAVEKLPSTFRILGLGDSYLYGQGVRAEDVCLRRVEEMLRRARPDLSVETINAGISGMNTAQERDLLVGRGFAYSPDLVIVHFVPNDVEEEADLYREGPKVELYEEYVTVTTEPDALSRVSALWAFVRSRWILKARGEAYLEACLESYRDDDAKWARCREALADIARHCRNRDVRLLVVVFPFLIGLDGSSPFQPIHDAVEAFCGEQGIAVLDLTDAFAGFDGPELWVHPTDPHPNEHAHARAAEAIAERLLSDPALLPR